MKRILIILFVACVAISCLCFPYSKDEQSAPRAFFQALAEGAVTPPTLPIRGDLDGDGSINLGDLSLLSRYIAGWDVEIAPDPVVPPIVKTYTVIFVDWDGTVLSAQTVDEGDAALPPKNPERSGYIFSGWDKSFDSISSDLTVTANYMEITDPTFSVDKVTASAGSTDIEVPVTLTNNPGLAGMTLSVSFDDSVLTLTKVVSEEVLDGLTFQKPKTYKNGSNLVWYGAEPDEVADGIAFTLVFNVSASAQSGTYPVNITYSTGYDVDLNSIEVNVVNGSITVS